MAKKQESKSKIGDIQRQIKKNRAGVVRTHTGKNKWIVRQWLHLDCMSKSKIIIIFFTAFLLWLTPFFQGVLFS
jgi:hypothetical protein